MRVLAIALASTLALAACGDRLGTGGGAGNDAVDLNAGGAGGVVPGSVNDPNSVAHFQQIVGDRVLFAVDQSTLTPEAQSTLTAQAEWMTANPEFTALVEGHADEQGTREYNRARGGRRANAVRDFLVSQGVQATRLRT
ncbi:MAG: OmpA family protein, partial [Pseudomonadota bacterium]